MPASPPEVAPSDGAGDHGTLLATAPGMKRSHLRSRSRAASRRAAMRIRFGLPVALIALGLSACAAFVVGPAAQPPAKNSVPDKSRVPDAVQAAQTTRPASGDRPELRKGEMDNPERFKGTAAAAVDSSLADQPRGGENTGFDFFRDGLNTDKPMVPFADVFKQDVADKPKVMD